MSDIKSGFDELSKKLLVRYAEIAKTISFDFLARVQELTPVDTGRARAGWRIKNGKNPLENIVFNEVDYIVYLERGHSKQAPAGMVKIALDELRRKVK